MQLDLNDEETLALLNLLTETIECDRYPFSPRDRTLRGILANSARWHRHPPARQTANARGTEPEPTTALRSAAAL